MQAESRALRLFLTMSKVEGYLKANDLAAQMDVSERTIKSDMGTLKQYAEEHGCRLVSVRGKGYALQVEDPEKYQTTKDRLEILFNNSDREDSESRVFRIARAIMVHTDRADGFIRLEDLAEELYLSESDLKKKMPEVRELFASYNLKLYSRPGMGIRVAGDELGWRLCMVELYENHFHTRVVTFNEEYYEERFADRGDMENVRRTILETFRNSNIALYDILMNRMVIYLILMRNRTAAGHFAASPACQSNPVFAEHKTCRERKLAHELLRTLTKYEDYVHSEEEEDVLTLLILMWRDWGIGKEGGEWEELYREAAAVRKDLARHLEENYHMPPIMESDELVSEIESVLVWNIVQIWSSYSSHRISGSAVSKNQIKSSPLCMVLADCVADHLFQRYGKWINEYTLQVVAVMFFRITQKIVYPYKRRRLLIATRNGWEGGKLIQENIERRFGSDYIEQITVDQLYECRKYPVEAFDGMIGTHHAYAYRY